MPIPNNILREHILEAIAEINGDGVRPGREGQRYFLIDNNINYPLKYVISIANKYANGKELDPDPNNFNTYSAWNYLTDLNFKLVDIQEDKIVKYNGFKLISLELENNTLVCKNSSITYNFLDDNDLQNDIYSTVIIGSNGTGKSNLFRIIILLLKEIYDQKEKKGKNYSVDGKYKIEYSIDENIFSYSNFYIDEGIRIKNNTQLIKNSVPIDLKEAELPAFIVANSIMLTDKYPFIRDTNSFPIYKYLGVRNIAQSASTRSYVRKTVEFIVEQINSKIFELGVLKIGNFLGISKSIDVFFNTLNTTLFFKGNLEIVNIENYFDAIEKKYKELNRQPPFKLNNYKSIAKDKNLMQEIVNLCNKLYHNKRLNKIDNSSAKIIRYNIVDNTSYNLLKEEYNILEHLRRLGMISAPEINLNKEDAYNLAESSSGEYHFFSSMIGLLATVKPNSLIFIDEPEISLHPNWQMKYLSFLRELLSEPEFATSHIILASHSHFIISDLRGENSKIIGLKRGDDNNLEIVNLPKSINTFGWSAENVLLNVFNDATTRNFYIAERLSEIFKIASMSKNPNLEKYKDELISWQKQLTENDPLHYTISQLIKKMKWLD